MSRAQPSSSPLNDSHLNNSLNELFSGEVKKYSSVHIIMNDENAYLLFH